MERTLLITGTSRGLGRALADTALAAGARVVATARDTDTLRDLLERYPETARTVPLDVTDAQAARGVPPRRAAEVVLSVLDLADPPLWLPLSGEAVDHIRRADQRKLAELDRWERLSRSADTEAPDGS